MRIVIIINILLRENQCRLSDSSILINQTLNQFRFLKRGLGWETRNCQQTKNNFDFHKEKCLVLIKVDKLAVKLSGLGFLNFSFCFAFFCSTFFPSDWNILSSFKKCCAASIILASGYFSISVLAESISGSTMCILWSQSLCLDLINHSGFLEPFQNIKIFLQNSILQ